MDNTIALQQPLYSDMYWERHAVIIVIKAQLTKIHSGGEFDFSFFQV